LRTAFTFTEAALRFFAASLAFFVAAAFRPAALSFFVSAAFLLAARCFFAAAAFFAAALRAVAFFIMGEYSRAAMIPETCCISLDKTDNTRPLNRLGY
jgi:hypothetical protein